MSAVRNRWSGKAPANKSITGHAARASVDAPAPMRADSPAPPLHAALDYCTRRLLAALDATGNGRTADVHAGAALAAQLTPASDRLLRWWFSTDTCRARIDNFHFAQRESILHTILAYELLRSDDPALLYRRACGPPLVAETPLVANARYALRLTPGGGARWVLQALLVWWWANAAVRADAGCESAAGIALHLIAATPGIRRNLQEALFGHADRHAASDLDLNLDRGSLLRHARLFLPPDLRAPFREWLRTQSQHDEGSLQIAENAEHPGDGPVLTLVAMSGANASATGSSRSDSFPGSRLQVDVMLAGDPDTAIVDAPLERMIRRGAAKLPMLEATATLRLPALRMKPARGRGLRPRLSRSHPALLCAGIDALMLREPGFATLEPARRPRMLVLCDTPSLLPAARRFLIDSGFAPGTIAIGSDRACRDDVRAVLDSLPARSTLADARICVVVVLRTHRGGIEPLAVVAAGAAPLWPEPDFADIRSENRERAMHRRAPQNLIDVLSVIEHPQCHAAYAPLLRAGLSAHRAHAGRDMQGLRNAGAAPMLHAPIFPAPINHAPISHTPIHHVPAVDDPAIDDLIVVALQKHVASLDLALPLSCVDGPQGQERLSHMPQRVLRRRHALAVRKSIYEYEGGGINDSGLWRAFLECAESDPQIESHGLIDPRRHGPVAREAWLAQGFATRVWPEAVVRTADQVYLVNFQPFCPIQPLPADAAERRYAHWLRRVNALPAMQRDHRVWCRAMLAAPLFWSWKRSEGTLSALLSALADGEASTRRDDIII